MNDGSQSTGKARTFLAADPLRAVAALAVVVFHTAYFVAPPHFYGAYGSLAGHVLGGFHLGLFVFFVLSGYLVSRPFVHAFVAAEPLPQITGYAVRRVMRIVPAFWAVLTIQLLFGGFFHASIGQLVLTYGFAQNLTHGPITRVMNQAWTLDVECAFYVFVPILMLLLSACCRGHGRVKRTQVFLVALVLMAAASVCARAFGPGAFAWQTALPSMLVAFLPGVALAVAETTSVPEWLARRSGRVPAAIVLAGLAVLGVYSAGVWAARPPLVGTQSVDAVGFLLASLGAAGVVAGFRAREYTVGSSWRVIDNRVLRWIGVRSYSLYLVHRAVALAVVIVASSVASTAGARLVILLPIVVAVSVAAAAASFRYVERPAMRAQAIVGGRADRRLQRASEAQGALCG